MITVVAILSRNLPHIEKVAETFFVNRAARGGAFVSKEKQF